MRKRLLFVIALAFALSGYAVGAEAPEDPAARPLRPTADVLPGMAVEPAAPPAPSFPPVAGDAARDPFAVSDLMRSQVPAAAAADGSAVATTPELRGVIVRGEKVLAAIGVGDQQVLGTPGDTFRVEPYAYRFASWTAGTATFIRSDGMRYDFQTGAVLDGKTTP